MHFIFKKVNFVRSNFALAKSNLRVVPFFENKNQGGKNYSGIRIHSHPFEWPRMSFFPPCNKCSNASIASSFRPFKTNYPTLRGINLGINEYC